MELDPQCIHDCPMTRKSYKTNVLCATCPSGHGHPLHHHMQSPALILRLQQAIEHGFLVVWCAMCSFFSTARHSAKMQALGKSSTFSRVSAVFVIAVLTMMAMSSIGPSLLLFMNDSTFTSSTDISAYVTASALSSAIPVGSNILLGILASKLGPGRALMICSLAAAFGIFVVAVARESVFIFFIGYALYASSNSIRVLRVALLTKIVPEHERTTVLATHALMTPIGALIGPLIWIAFSSIRNNVSIGMVSLDRFSLLYFTASGVLLCIAVISGVMFHSFGTRDQASGGQEEEQVLGEVVLHESNGQDITVNLQAYRKQVFVYFCGIMLFVNMSAGIYMTAFQPLLVNSFHVSDAKLGVIFETVAVFAILPPLLVALLSRYLLDRQIMLIGLTSKLVGMALFLPLFGPVREWQVIAGFVLIIKASIFFSTASMSLFTKLLGSMGSASLIGFLASGSSVGPAVAQIILSDHIVRLFGSFWFGLFAVPAVIGVAMVLWPNTWECLDPGLEFHRLLTREMRNAQRSE